MFFSLQSALKLSHSSLFNAYEKYHSKNLWYLRRRLCERESGGGNFSKYVLTDIETHNCSVISIYFVFLSVIR